MTLAELRKLVAATPNVWDSTEVKVWLPGSTISMTIWPEHGFLHHQGALCIEGNVDPGSALCDDEVQP